MRSVLFITAVLALAVVASLRIYGPYHDSEVFRQRIDDMALGALEKNDETLSAEIASAAREVSLEIPEGGVKIVRGPGGYSVEIHVEYQGVIDLFVFRHTVDFSAYVKRERSFPALMIQRSRERVEKSLKEHEGVLDEKIREIDR